MPFLNDLEPQMHHAEAFSSQALCLCSMPWYLHAGLPPFRLVPFLNILHRSCVRSCVVHRRSPVNAPPIAIPPGPASIAIPPALPAPHSGGGSHGLLSPTSVPPIHAFQTRHHSLSVDSSNVAAARRASISRNLPQHRAPSGTPSVATRTNPRSPYPAATTASPFGTLAPLDSPELKLRIAIVLLPLTVGDF